MEKMMIKKSEITDGQMIFWLKQFIKMLQAILDRIEKPQEPAVKTSVLVFLDGTATARRITVPSFREKIQIRDGKWFTLLRKVNENLAVYVEDKKI